MLISVEQPHETTSLPKGATMPGGISRLLAAFDDQQPLARATAIPSSWYHDPALHEIERRAVFGNTWQRIGRAEQLANPGDFITADVAGEPILVVRGPDGVVRGFFNVCRHRAATVLAEPAGCVTKLRCRYHGWTYDLLGQLRGVPEFDGAENFCRDDHGLVPVAAEVWGPFVFVHLGSPREPVAAYLDPLPVWAAAASPFVGLRWFAQRRYDVNCNWKVYIDNYLDGGYHVNTVHPDLAGVLDYKEYVTTTHGHTALQSSPLVPATGDAGRTRTGTAAHYWWVYPNFMLNHYAGVMDTNLVRPIGPNRCEVLFDFYFTADADPAFVADSLAVADRVQAEDAGVCDDVQRGLHSRSYVAGRFSPKRENAGYFFHQTLAAQLRRAAAE
jgi:choline monooxygenase